MDKRDEIPKELRGVRKVKQKRDWWQKGKAIDLWSIPHFLFGVLLAFLPHFTAMSFLSSLELTAILSITWEIYEKFIGIKETVLNSLFDIIFAIAGFAITSEIFFIYAFQRDELLVAFGAILIIYAFTNISGWLAYRRRVSAFWQQ